MPIAHIWVPNGGGDNGSNTEDGGTMIAMLVGFVTMQSDS